MKVLSRYQFTNEKAFETRYLNRTDQRKLDLPECDFIALRIENDQIDMLYLRPDEALILAQMLTDAVWKTAKSFEVGLIRHNGFTD